MIRRGDVCWADLPEPVGSEAGFRRPVVVVQRDSFNRSLIRTVICVPLTGNLEPLRMPGTVLLEPVATGLERDSVANASQILAVDRSRLGERAGRLSPDEVDRVLHAIDAVIGR